VFWFDLPGIFSLSLQDFPQPPVVDLTLESLWSHKQHVKHWKHFTVSILKLRWPPALKKCRVTILC